MQKFEPTISLRSADVIMAKFADPQNPDTVIESMVEAGNLIATSAAKVQSTVEKIMANQMQPEIKRKKEARDAAFKIFEGAAKRIDSNRAAVESVIIKLEADTLPKAPKDAVEMLGAGEVRRALLAAPQSERARMIRGAINDGDDSFVAAAVLANVALTGLGRAERDALREEWRRVRHGETVNRIARLRAALDQIDRLAGMFSGYANALFVDDNAALKAAEASEVAASAAIENAAA
jgi:hypothetical protein